MAQVLSLVNGVPRTISVADGGGTFDIKEEGVVVVSGATALDFRGLTVTAEDGGSNVAIVTISSSLIYDRTLTAGSGGITAGTPVTLPANGSYTDIEMSVYVAGQFMEPGVDYNYVGTGPGKTQVTFVDNINQGETIRFRIEDSVTVTYDETYQVLSNITAGSPITLPSGGTYDDVELKVYLNGQFIEPGDDYNYVGSGSGKTQITLTEDIAAGEELRFRIEESSVTIYDETIEVVSGAPANGNEITGPVTTGSNITLPNSGSFVGQELEVYLNGELIEAGIDWNYQSSSVISRIQMTFDLVVGDKLRFRIDSLDTI